MTSQFFDQATVPGVSMVPEAIGRRLRRIRTEWDLSVQDVAERSLQLAQQTGNASYQISASWLARLEREEHELTATKLRALSAIYNLSYKSILDGQDRELESSVDQTRLIGPNATVLVDEGQLANQTRGFLSGLSDNDSPEETAFLPAKPGEISNPYRLAILGRKDRSLNPMIAAGAILQIQTHKRAITPRGNWTNEFDRPIYMILARSGYACGWCELGDDSNWLTLVPHPLSRANTHRWRFKKEVEVVGQVVGVSMRLGRNI